MGLPGRRDIFSSLGKNYVRIGQFFHAPSQVTKALHRHVKALVCTNDSEAFPYTVRGSLTAISLNGRYFTVFCLHQIFGYEPSKVVLFPLAGHGKQLIGGEAARSIEPNSSNSDEEYLDVCAIEYKIENYSMGNLGSEFFPVIPDDCWPTNTTGDLIAFGLPSQLQSIAIGEAEAGAKLDGVNFETVVVSARHLQPSHAQWVHEAEMQRTTSFGADGMSGGPVFHLGRDANGLFVGLAGMIMRGGQTSDRFRFIDTGFLRQFADT